MCARLGGRCALGCESLTAKHAGSQAVGFGGLDVAARFRIRPAFEIPLALAAAGSEGIPTAGVFAELR